MRGRVAGLLDDRSYAEQYERLYDLRSAFLHGRAMTAISTEERVMARSLARKVVEALILATRSGPVSSRENVLDDLLDHLWRFERLRVRPLLPLLRLVLRLERTHFSERALHCEGAVRQRDDARLRIDKRAAKNNI